MSQNPDAREKKRAQFAAPRTSKTRKAGPIVIIALIGTVAYFVGTNLGGQPAPSTVSVAAPAAPPEEGKNGATPAGGDVEIPLSDLRPDTAKFFQYVASDKTTVRFFVIRSSDGVYRAALDACDVCYHEKLGYEQSGDDMVCRKCGQHFPSRLVNEVTGGCNPIALTRTVAGNKLLIKAGDLESMKTYF